MSENKSPDGFYISEDLLNELTPEELEKMKKEVFDLINKNKKEENNNE